MKLSDRLPKHERPRERLLRHGAAALQDSELLAIALRTGIPGLDVVELGSRLLTRFGGLRGLLGATPEELTAVPGLGVSKACMLAALLELARREFYYPLPTNTLL
jgi:DNA repair protein RadC